MLSIENIDYTVAYYIERAIIDAGFFPDRDSFLPASPTNQTLFDAALDAVVADKGFIIEVFSTANYTSRANIKSCNIIVERTAMNPARANISRGQIVFKEQGEGYFDRITLPQTVWDIDYQIRLITDFVGTERAATALVLGLFDMGKYFEPIEISAGERAVIADEQAVFIAPSPGSTDLSGTGYIERVYQYQAKHVGITPQTVTQVPGMSEIEFILNPLKQQ